MLETVSCYLCRGNDSSELLLAQDDLTGKPGWFRFVQCDDCGLAFQNPRLPLSEITNYYDDDYIAHRKHVDWGVMARFFERSMETLDERKEELVNRFVSPASLRRVLDVGCGAGTFLARLQSRYALQTAVGVDFKDLSSAPSFEQVEFRLGLIYEQRFDGLRFDLITMWHFLEHDYDPIRSLTWAAQALSPEGRLVIEVPRLDSVTYRLYGHRWPGLQAPQHTILFTRESLLRSVEAAGLELVEHLSFGAFPAYFYVFAGVAFRILRGRGLNLGRAIVPYAIGQFALKPVLFFENRLNLAMQTVVCRRRS